MPLRQQREQDFHSLLALLNMTEVVNDSHLETRESFRVLAQFQVALSDQQILHEQTAGTEQDLAAGTQQFLRNCAQEVSLSASRSPQC
jgi:hypothetical protein